MQPSLLVLAAGIGSRYGSLKQVDKFGPNGESIIDYSVYDAIKAGFRKVVFVVRKNMGEEFHELIAVKFQDKIEVKFVYQELENIPTGIRVPEERIKPWGTAHAVMVAEEEINEPFAVINADDFYGRGAYQIVYDFLSQLENLQDSIYCIVGYQLSKTLSDHGHVSRAICEKDERGNLKSIIERTQIFREKDAIVFQNEHDEKVLINGDPNVSMNMMGFTPSFFKHLFHSFEDFISNNYNNLKSELYLPFVIGDVIDSGLAVVKVLETNESWFGVTYKEDKAIVTSQIRSLINNGIYPERLWEG